jgi:hypothetical protein
VTPHTAAPIHAAAFRPPRRFNVIERMAAIANRHLASVDVPRVLERWIEGLEAEDGVRWIERSHPCYELTFVQHVRGQALRVFLDYHARSGFLGLFIYWPRKVEPGAVENLCKAVNKINCEALYGSLELHPDEETLRYRLSVNVRGVRLMPAFLSFMLESGLRTMHDNARSFLAGSTKMVANQSAE